MRSLPYILCAILLAGVVFLLWDRGSTKATHTSDRLEWSHQLDSVRASNTHTLSLNDSLQRTIEAEREQQRWLDSLDAAIDSDPRFRIGTYRDSTTEAKLNFIIGRK